jgi:hypothetical protein
MGSRGPSGRPTMLVFLRASKTSFTSYKGYDSGCEDRFDFLLCFEHMLAGMLTHKGPRWWGC